MCNIQHYSAIKKTILVWFVVLFLISPGQWDSRPDPEVLSKGGADSMSQASQKEKTDLASKFSSHNFDPYWNGKESSDSGPVYHLSTSQWEDSSHQWFYI